MCDTCRPASSALIPQYQLCRVPAGVCRERGVGEQSLCMSLLGEVPFRGLSKTWLQLQLCSSNTVLFFTFDLNSTGCFWGAVSSPVPPAGLPGACRDHPLPWQRAGKGLELLRSPPSSLLARRNGVFSYQHGIAGICPAWGPSLAGWRALASPKRDPGGFPCPILSWDHRVPEQPPSELSLAGSSLPLGQHY